jgi:hypothetical protein
MERLRGEKLSQDKLSQGKLGQRLASTCPFFPKLLSLFQN